MPDPVSPVRLRSKPGIKRDGTRFEGDNYVDGLWVRFQRGLPRKIGGYRRLTQYIDGVVRQFYTRARDTFVYTHVGHGEGVQRFTIDASGNASAPVDRTPAGFADGDYAWGFDAMFDSAGASTVIFAVATDTLTDISSTTAMDIYYGDVYDTAALDPLVESTSMATLTTAGTIVVLHPYLFILDANGHVRWSDINDPTNFTSGDAGDAYITSSKLVQGLPLRGGGQAPAGLIWSLDGLIRVTYTGSTDIFRFDTITGASSILSANSVIEYDGIYYWIGLDRFLMYNGVLREVPNETNINYFFDGLNFAHAAKTFAFKVPRFGEIWWCYPRGDATECSHAIIYNVREGSWYDTPLPEGGRSAALYAQVYRSPLMAGVTDSDDGYKIWRHETGVDAIDGSDINAIRSYFETGDISLLTIEKPMSKSILVQMMEPDFVQSGDMTVRMKGRINARAPEVEGPVLSFPAVASSGAQETVKFDAQLRELRFLFESNTIGGNYECGDIFVHIGPSDGRTQS